MRTVAVIGGGASGMLAAITAAQAGAKILLLEHKDRIGKKLLATGNGRCNFTNLHQEPSCYRSEDPAFPWKIVSQFDTQAVLEFFRKLGICYKDRNGYCYPYSDQASAVLEALRMELERLGVDVRTEIQVRDVLPIHNAKARKQGGGFRIETDQGTLSVDRVILCTGSKAAPSTGSDGSGYDLAKSLGHRMIPVLPALVQLRCEGKFFKSISGVRVHATVSVWNGDICLATDTGELQLTDYGLSGIPVFQISRYAAQAIYQKEQVRAAVDFLPECTEEATLMLLRERAKTRPKKTADQFFIGLFHKKLSELMIRLSGIPREKPAGTFSEEELRCLTCLIKDFRAPVSGTNSFAQAQVCRGGVDTSQVDSETLESRLVPGLYFAGELLDVDGICGGYNLQFAWSSGYVAGKHAAV